MNILNKKILKFHSPLSRFIWLIATIAIVITAVIVIMETLSMQTILSTSNPDIRLNQFDDKITLFTFISLIAIFITFIAGIFLLVYNTNATKMRNQKIANLSESLLEANKKIIELTENVDTQEVNLTNAQIKLAETELSLKDSDKKIEETKKVNLELATNLENERQKTLQMQKELAPRDLEQYNSVKLLQKFDKYTVMIKYIPGDYETQRFVGMINFMVSQTGWTFKNTLAQPNEHIRDGVRFEAFGERLQNGIVVNESPVDTAENRRIMNDPNLRKILASYYTFNIGNQLIEIFKENNIDVQYGGIGQANPQPRSIYMEVGLKPNKFDSGIKTDSIRSISGNIIY